MSARLAAADAIVTALTTAGVTATADVREAAANLPCVLVPPPRVEFTALAVRWRLILLARDALGSRQSWEELDALLDAVEAVLPVEAADPISYTLPVEGTAALPAYAVTLTT